MHQLLRRISSMKVPKALQPLLSENVLNVLIILAPSLSFVPQYLKIRSTRSSKGFSSLVCLCLLTAHILRCFYWIHKRFDVGLLYQSVALVATQLLLLEAIVRFRKVPIFRRRQKAIFLRILELKKFWDYESITDYVAVLSVFVALLASAVALNEKFFHWVRLWDVFGVLGTVVEATIAVPILAANVRSKSTEGLSAMLILSWFLGDAFKIFTFWQKRAPYMFSLCAMFQMLVDVLILGQMYLYRKKSKPKRA